MALVKIWANRIIAGTQVFSKCPETYKGVPFRDQVDYELQSRVVSGEITQEKYEELIKL